MNSSFILPYTFIHAANLTVSGAKSVSVAVYIAPVAGFALLLLATTACIIAILARLRLSRKKHLYEDIKAAGKGKGES